jgi:asparagine synthase (glutamine-hydrolysing)
LQNASFQSSCVWDGFVPEQPSPTKILKWKQPFAIAAILQDQLFLARDPLGTKPLYYGQTESGSVFASEVKALLPLTKRIYEFPPGHWYSTNAGFNAYYQLKSENLPHDDLTQIVDKLRQKLEECC